MAQAHHDPLLAQGGDHLRGPVQFRCQGHQVDIGLKAADSLLQRRQIGPAEVLLGMGSPPAGLKKRPLQMGTQQLGAPALVLLPGFGQHRQGLAQRGHTAGHQGGTDRLHPIPPEQLEQFQQPGQIGGREFREGQPQPAIDL